MPQYWSRQMVGKVGDSVINYEYKESIMRVADWIAPRDITPESGLTLRLEMIPQL